MRPGALTAIRSLLHSIETETAFAEDLAWLADDTEAIGDPASAETMRDMVRRCRVVALRDRARLGALFAAYGLHAFQDDYPDGSKPGLIE